MAGVRASAYGFRSPSLKALERENRELRRANEILRKSVGGFLRGGARPPTQVMTTTSTIHSETRLGSSRSAARWRSPRRPITLMLASRPDPAKRSARANETPP